MRIACLHTTDSNVGVFEKTLGQLNLPMASLFHEVRADLLTAAELAGGLTFDIRRQTREAMLSLAHDADALLLKPSVFSPHSGSRKNSPYRARWPEFPQTPRPKS